MIFKDYSITSDECDFFYKMVTENNIQRVLEFGTGISTIIFLRIGCYITTFETSKRFVETEFPTLKSELKCNIIYYIPENLNTIHVEDRFDIAFVDGPRGIKHLSRLESCLYCLDKTNHILLHDFQRGGEQETFKYIVDNFPEWKLVVINTKRKIGYLFNSKETLPLKI